MIPIGIMHKTKKEFCNGFYGNYRNFYCFYCIFFQQGNDTHTVLHIIDNIEPKLDFANLKYQIAIAISVKKNRN